MALINGVNPTGHVQALRCDNDGKLLITGIAEASKAEIFAIHSVSMNGDVVTPDASTYNFFDIYLNRPTTRINMPSGGVNGEPIRFQLRQDGTGGRHVVWGTKVENTGLTCTINKGMGDSLIIYITGGTFDWSLLNSAGGRKSYLTMSGFAQNSLNVAQLKLSSFDESAGTITLDYTFSDSVVDVTGATGINISYENGFYFQNESGDTWHGLRPYSVTLYEYFDTASDGSGMLTKQGIYMNSASGCMRTTVRDEETLTDDFINGNDDGLLNWREGGSNHSINQATGDVSAEHPGVIYMRANGLVTADARAYFSMGSDQIIVDSMRAGVEGIIKFDENALETADMKYFFGWSDNTLWHSANDGAFFEIVADGSVEGKGRVHCILLKAGVRVDYDTGVDLFENEWHVLRIGKSSNNLKLKFSVDDIILYYGNYADMGGTVKMTCGYGLYYDYTGTPLPENKAWYFDAFAFKYRMCQDRI